MTEVEGVVRRVLWERDRDQPDRECLLPHWLGPCTWINYYIVIKWSDGFTVIGLDQRRRPWAESSRAFGKPVHGYIWLGKKIVTMKKPRAHTVRKHAHYIEGKGRVVVFLFGGEGEQIFFFLLAVPLPATAFLSFSVCVLCSGRKQMYTIFSSINKPNTE